MADLNGCEGNAKFNVVNIMSNTPQSNNDHSISEHLLAKATAKYLSENSRIERFQEESGVILFLLSLVITRGIDCIRSGECGRGYLLNHLNICDVAIHAH